MEFMLLTIAKLSRLYIYPLRSCLNKRESHLSIFILSYDQTDDELSDVIKVKQLKLSLRPVSSNN